MLSACDNLSVNARPALESVACSSRLRRSRAGTPLPLARTSTRGSARSRNQTRHSRTLLRLLAVAVLGLPIALTRGAEQAPPAAPSPENVFTQPTLAALLTAAENAFVREERVELAPLADAVRAHFASDSSGGDDGRLLVERYLRLVVVVKPASLPGELGTLAASPSEVVRSVAHERQEALRLSVALSGALADARQGNLPDLEELRAQIDAFLTHNPRSTSGRNLVESYMRLFQAVQLAQQAAEWRRFVASPNAPAADLAAEHMRSSPTFSSANLSNAEMRERMQRVADEIRRRRDQRRQETEGGMKGGGRPTSLAPAAPDGAYEHEEEARLLVRELLDIAARERARFRAAAEAKESSPAPVSPAPAN
jgi:hypothetical protein